MGATSYTFSWDNFNTSTMLLYGKQITDNIFDKNVIFTKLMEKKGTYDGGKTITVPIETGTHTATTYDGYNPLAVAEPQIITDAYYNVANYQVPIVISKEDFDANNGTPKILDLLSTLHQNAQKTLEQRINADLWGDGNPATYGTKCLWGLKAHIRTAPSANVTAGALGGIDAATNGFWQNQAFNFSASGSISQFTRYHLQNHFQSVVDGNERPDLIVTTYDIFNQLYRTADTQMLIPPSPEYSYKFGMDAMWFRGAPIIYDKLCPAGCIFLMNTQFLQLKVATHNNFQTGPWIMTPQQLAQTKHLTTSMVMISTKPKRQKVIFGIH